MKKRVIWVAVVALVTGACAQGGGAGSAGSIAVGAVYPLSGSQGPGGRDEFRGVRLATDMVNRDGGIDGRTIDLRPVDTADSDAAPGAIDLLNDKGVRFVMGSYGTTISGPAAAEAVRKGMLFWESGAVGDMDIEMGTLDDGSPRNGLVFRVPPTGVVLGRAAISFIAKQLAAKLHRPASSLRFAVANVHDVYGDSVARGALRAIRSEHLHLVGHFPYDAAHLKASKLVRDVASAGANVLFVSAYLDDGIALRRAIVRRHLPLLANIGTSSSFCMSDFGEALGRGAVGLFASDKPAAGALNLTGLSPGARKILVSARRAFRSRYHETMSAPALAGFSAAWALFKDVMPRASELTPQGVAAAARQMHLPKGALPNGSGLQFGAIGGPDASNNVRAESVIWEWTGVGHRSIVWPPRYATTKIKLFPTNR